MEMELKRKIAEGTECTQYQVIRLTDEEMRHIFYYVEHQYDMEDVRQMISELFDDDDPDDIVCHGYYGMPTMTVGELKALMNDDEKISNMADTARDAMSNSNSFMGCLWECVKYGIIEELNEEE